MSESSTPEDKDSKTEEATEKKRTDAIEKGNIPIARDVYILTSLAAFWIFLTNASTFGLPYVTVNLGSFWASADEIRLSTIREVADLFGRFLQILFFACSPIVFIGAVLGLAGRFFQGPFKFRLERISPKLSNLSPIKGAQRIFGVAAIWEFLKSLSKTTILIVACVYAIVFLMPAIKSSALYDYMLAPAIIAHVLKFLTIGLLAALIVIVGIDIFLVRLKWKRDLRMSRHELKEEFKQVEGDPLIKSRLRSMAQSRARKRMIAEIPKATLVIANPTHYAIAMRYVREEGGAPMVVAKGVDFLAIKIREIARMNDIPVIENKSLARQMYNDVEIGKAIPSSFYRAVAEIIVMLNAIKSGQRYEARTQVTEGVDR